MNDSGSSNRAPLRTVPKGVMHVPVTPFKNDLSVDYGTFEKLVMDTSQNSLSIARLAAERTANWSYG